MPKKISFEAKLEKLAEIVETVDDAATPLDEAISLYKNGVTLAAECGEILRRHEEEILILQKNVEEFSLSPFSAGD